MVGYLEEIVESLRKATSMLAEVSPGWFGPIADAWRSMKRFLDGDSSVAILKDGHVLVGCCIIVDPRNPTDGVFKAVKTTAYLAYLHAMKSSRILIGS